MIVGFVEENNEFEIRSALLPEHIGLLKKLGFKVLISNDYAKKLNLKDDLFINNGAEAKPTNDVIKA